MQEHVDVKYVMDLLLYFRYIWPLEVTWGICWLGKQLLAGGTLISIVCISLKLLHGLCPHVPFLIRHQGAERGVQIFHKATSRASAHGFLGAVELERPLASLWCIVRDHSKTHLYHESIKSAWTRPLDECTQLGKSLCTLDDFAILDKFLNTWLSQVCDKLMPLDASFFPYI